MNIAPAPATPCLAGLLPLFERECAAGNAMVLATVIDTRGPTYTKAGAQLLIASNGDYAGLLSGGCLEGDLGLHAREVLTRGETRLLHYDARAPEDLLFGLGSGCEGTMDILLQRLSAGEQWQPLARLATAWRERRLERYALVTHSSDVALPRGATIFGDGTIHGALASRLAARIASMLARWPDGDTAAEPADVSLSIISQYPPARLLILGAGADARPVAQLAEFLGWSVTVFDHRAAYVVAQRFPAAATLVHAPCDALTAKVVVNEYSAAIVMSHHYLTDLAYLRVLARTTVPYVGLLGPIVRRDRLLTSLGEEARSLGKRLHAPVGLDIGAASPEAIALAIIGEIHVMLTRHHVDAQPASA